jgi:L-lactate dehydrogenase (cytochrome)
LKGILDVEDAKIAASLGVSAIAVSNHGGRQLDGTTSAISALPKVVEAVGADVEILFDGGIRSGQDVLRALAFGARACMIGRAAAYGVGASGEPGVAKALSIIRKQLDFSMALTGTRSITEIGPHILAGTHRGRNEVCDV